MNERKSLPFVKPSRPIDVFFNEIYFNKSHDTEFKSTIIKFIKELKEFKEKPNTSFSLKKITISVCVMSKKIQ